MLVHDTGMVGDTFSTPATYAAKNSEAADKGAAKRTTSLWRRFARDEDGNIIFLFAFMITILFLFAGGAVDYSRWNAVRADMIESMDASSLALAQLAATNPDLGDTELKEFGKKFFQANFNYEADLEAGWNINFELADDAVVATCITGTIKTYLLGVAGIKNLDIDKCVEVTKQGSGRVELALVLDVTGSMDDSIDGEKKIDSLKDAVDTLLDVMFQSDATSDNIKIGVVPFNAYVNPGGASSWTNSWADENANAYYHGARFFHVDENGVVDMDTKVNHFNLYDSVPTASWQGCVEARPYPLDELDISPGGSISSSDISDEMDTPSDYTGTGTSTQDDRNADAFDDAPSYAVSMSTLTDVNNTRWVPLFHPDEPDCNNTDDCESSGYSESGTVDGVNWYGYFFDDPDNDGSHPSGTVQESSYSNRYFVNDWNFTHYNNGTQFEKYVPIANYFREVMIGNITDTKFEELMESFGIELSNATERSHARGRQEYIARTAYVGYWDPATETYEYKYNTPNSLDSSRGPELNCPTEILPLTNTRATIETHVDSLFPNGTTNSAHGAAWGWRILSPDAPFTEGIGPGDTDYEKWQKAVVIMTDGENVVGSQSTHWDSSLGSYGFAVESRMGANMDDRGDMRDEIDNKLLRVCHRMKSQGYLVYTIMFGLDSTNAESVFKACATKPTKPYFHDAADGDDLDDAFGEIAADLVDLHISK